MNWIEVDPDVNNTKKFEVADDICLIYLLL